MLRDLQKVAMMGIRTKRVACTALSAGLQGQSSGRAPGQTNSKVAECPGVPTLQSDLGESQAPLPGSKQETPSTWGGGRGGGGSQGLLTQLRRTATCQDNPHHHHHCCQLDLCPLPGEGSFTASRSSPGQSALLSL